jgi:hypothetical protein
MFKDAAWNRLRFYWSAVSGVTGYRLRRKISGDPDSNLVLIYDGDGLEHYDFPVALDYTSASNPARTWEWRLHAYNDDGESAGYSTQVHVMSNVTDANVNGMELLHPSYNDGSDKSASYSDIAKSGSGGASDPSANEAVLFNGQLWTNSI